MPPCYSIESVLQGGDRRTRAARISKINAGARLLMWPWTTEPKVTKLRQGRGLSLPGGVPRGSRLTQSQALLLWSGGGQLLFLCCWRRSLPGHPGLQSEPEDSQGYTEKPRLSRKTKNRKKKEKEAFFLLRLSLPPPFPLSLTSSSSTTSCSQEGRQNKFLTDTALSLESSGALNSDKQGLTIFRILTCCEFCFSPSGVQNPRPCAHYGNFNLSFQANFSVSFLLTIK